MMPKKILIDDSSTNNMNTNNCMVNSQLHYYQIGLYYQ